MISLSSVLIAASLRCRLGPIVGDTMAAVLFTVPIVVSALYGGFWPGCFCTLISAVINISLFMDPFYGYPLDVEANILIFTFIINGLIISYFGQRLQMQKEELAQKAEKLIAKNGELARASEQKDEFLVMLAHELRNPLAGISAAVEILRIIRADQYRTTPNRGHDFTSSSSYDNASRRPFRCVTNNARPYSDRKEIYRHERNFARCN